MDWAFNVLVHAPIPHRRQLLRGAANAAATSKIGTVADVPTQCVQSGKAAGSKATDPQYHAGILLKINL